MLVGRGRELGEAGAALDAVAAGQGRLLVVVGEPGIGKTTLADAIAAKAAQRGFAVAWGRCWEGGGAPPLFPWLQVFEGLGLPLPAAAPALIGDASAARLHGFQATTDALATCARTRPIAIVLDDLHISDVSTLLLLQFVTHQLRRVGALIIATRRDADVALTEEASTLLARIAREGRTLPLRRLDRGEVATMVRDADGSTSDEVAATIWQATGGNPFFLDELLRLLAAHGGIEQATRGELPIPYGVREVIRQRLAGLAAPTRGVLEIAAACGVEVEPRLLGLAGPVDDIELTARLADAVRCGALIEAPGGRLRFAHALVQEVVHRDLPASRRAALHLAVAAALERMHPDAPPLVEIAHHALAAAPRDAATTLARVERAVRTWCAALSFEDAVALAERARAALEPTLADPALLARLLLVVGDARGAAGDLEAARGAFRRAAGHARAAGDGVALARAALGFGAEFTVGITDPTLSALLREALDVLPAEQPAWRARVQARLAAALQPAPECAALIRMAEEAIALARTVGDDATTLDVIHAGMAAMVAFVDPAIRRPLNERAATLAARLGDPGKELRAHLRLVFDCAELGDFAAAEARIDAYEQLAGRMRLASHLCVAALLRSMMALHEGRFGDADALADEASGLAGPERGSQVALLMHRFGRLRAEERQAESSGLEASMLDLLGNPGDRALMVGLMRAQVGDRAGAADALTALTDEHLGLEVIAAAVVAEVAWVIDDAVLARRAIAGLRPRAERWVCWGMSGVVIAGPVTRYLGQAALAAGQLDDARRWLTDALRRAEEAGARPEAARIRTLLARAVPADAAPTPMPAPALADALRWSLDRDGEVWTVQHDGRSFRLEDRLGVRYLARLVAEPDREIGALDLAGAGDGVDAGAAGAALDPEAKLAYRRRLEDIDDELAEAERFGDAIRRSRAEAERAFLAAELARAVGLGGRDRAVGSAAERARIAVTRRLRDAVKRIAAEDPALGRWLDRAVHTGRFCCYRPM